jgi:Raf kinase inhibitor-like YbhB/YbcL family protein
LRRAQIAAKTYGDRGGKKMSNFLRSIAVVTLLVLAGVGNAAAQQGQAPPPSQFKIMSSAFSDGSKIPTQFSCADPNATSPALSWSNPPAGAMSFVLVMHDPEGAPMKSSTDVTHWLVWNIAPSSSSLMADVKPDSTPGGIAQGKNVRGVNGYQPPCPPPGAVPHHYTFEFFALDTKLDIPAGSARADLMKAMDGHVIGKAAYIGLFGR